MQTVAHVCECGDHAWFPVTKGYVALVDPEMAPAVAPWRWHAQVDGKTVYVARNNSRVVNGRTFVWRARLHQYLLCLPEGWRPDHRNGNGLDNRRYNLRPSTVTENTINSRRARAASGFRGVKKDRTGRFCARIIVKKRAVHLGTFRQPEDAARAYDAAALTYFGEFACLNFPLEARP